MFQNNKRAAYLDYLMIIVGTALMAVAINSVFDMSGMVTGGFSGIAILVKEWTQGVIPGGIPLWITNMSLNIPLFLIGMKIGGFQFVKKALVGEVCLSFWLAVLPAFDLAGNDLLLAAVYGRRDPGNRNRPCISGKRNHRRYRYDGGTASCRSSEPG